MEENIIEVKDVYKSYGEVKALRGVSLSVPKGKVFGLLGPNGAGKTTLVRLLTTLLKPDQGFATIAGIDVAAHPAKVRSYIGLAGQYAAVDENLTGRENLELVGSLYHLPKEVVRAKAAELLKKFSLEDAAGRQVKTYSGGMRRRLDLAASLVGTPQVLFLDEPTTGLDPRSRLELWGVIEQLVEDGVTVLLTTQYLEEADYLADSIVLIDNGTVIAKGTAKELKEQIGGAVLELHLADRTKLEQGKALLQGLGDGEVKVDEVTGILTLPVAGGSQILIEAVRKLDSESLEVADIELRKPTLDEVFLKLTGQGEVKHD